jgi:hypothetical protein
VGRSVGGRRVLLLVQLVQVLPWCAPSCALALRTVSASLATAPRQQRFSGARRRGGTFPTTCTTARRSPECGPSVRAAAATSCRRSEDVTETVGYLFVGMVVFAVRPELLSLEERFTCAPNFASFFCSSILASFLDGARPTRNGRHIRIRVASGQCVDDPNALGHWAGRTAAPARYHGD